MEPVRSKHTCRWLVSLDSSTRKMSRAVGCTELVRALAASERVGLRLRLRCRSPWASPAGRRPLEPLVGAIVRRALDTPLTTSMSISIANPSPEAVCTFQAAVRATGWSTSPSAYAR